MEVGGCVLTIGGLPWACNLSRRSGYRPSKVGMYEELVSAYFCKSSQMVLGTRSAPALAMPDFSQPFVVETDACGRGIGVVLMQRGRPITYLRKALALKNLGLSAYEKKFLALLLAQKWVTKLLGLSYEVQYKKGNDNRTADALPRLEHDKPLPIPDQAWSCISMDFIEGLPNSKEFEEEFFKVYPVAILARRLIPRNNVGVAQVLIHWSHASLEQATWEDYSEMDSKFPSFDPWGQGSKKGEGMSHYLVEM
ncbi:UNVERIFIED_CONTAM: hypothetical protein Scaly_1056300 [Sesamum calycinum]|uniref:Reverse transcriptase/retrotransposon-derived protein RNase H-like domain-containing protein n=1 Tax=Sesamum calycinum TaxID=2727403 RepID=A0AAW2QKN7_9LAMI